MPLEGVQEMIASFREMAVRADEAGERVVSRSQTTFEAAVKRAYTQSHKAGTPTPSTPGSAPAVVSGTLRRGWVREEPKQVGIGTWSGRNYPTTVYARIQELGGQTGRGGATTIPARPVMAPTLAQIKPVLAGIHMDEFERVIGR